MPTCYPTHAAAFIRENSKLLTKEQRAELLRKAHILDADGNYAKGFFSKETIEKDKAHRQAK